MLDVKLVYLNVPSLFEEGSTIENGVSPNVLFGIVKFVIVGTVN